MDDLTFLDIKTFVDILQSTFGNDFEFIKEKFEASSIHFYETINFFSGLKLLIPYEEKIIIERDLLIFLQDNSRDENLIKQFLIDRLLNSDNAFTEDVESYLMKFQLTQDDFEYKPTTKKRLEDSGIRNTLMELDLIQYDHYREIYIISDKFVNIFSQYRKKKRLSPKGLAYLINRQEELGFAAEEEVLKFERERLKNKPEISKKIEHISVRDVNAGFDIKSYEYDFQQGSAIERFIEVKAVSEANYKFYWTRNEIKSSRKYGEQYYLYLLPVIASEKFAIGKILVIRDPYKRVLKSDEWEKQEEQYSVWKGKTENNE